MKKMKDYRPTSKTICFVETDGMMTKSAAVQKQSHWQPQSAKVNHYYGFRYPKDEYFSPWKSVYWFKYSVYSQLMQ